MWRRSGFVAVALAFVGIVWAVVATQWGWRDLPTDAPTESRVLDESYAEAAAEATQLLEAMRLGNGVPGATAAVAVDGRLVWVAGSGWANLETMTPVTPETVFRIGSTSKAITATVIARLVDAGLLALDDTVGEHVEVPLNPVWAPLTITQLLSHTSGLPGYEQNTDWFGAIGTLRMKHQYESVADSLALFDQSAMIGAPGAQFLYSSFDVNLAAHVAEEAAGDDYARLLHTRVREPLGVETPVLCDFGEPPERLATYYSVRGPGQTRRWETVNVSQRWPSGGLCGRSSDLVQVAGAWLDDEFIRPETRAQFWAPARLKDGPVNEENYALGWRSNTSTTRFGEAAPVRMVHHGGVSRGAMSWLVLYPELGIAIAVNINAQTPEFTDFASVEPAILRVFASASGRTPAAAE